jgi:hypothetical protein
MRFTLVIEIDSYVIESEEDVGWAAKINNLKN